MIAKMYDRLGFSVYGVVPSSLQVVNINIRLDLGVWYDEMFLSFDRISPASRRHYRSLYINNL